MGPSCPFVVRLLMDTVRASPTVPMADPFRTGKGRKSVGRGSAIRTTPAMVAGGRRWGEAATPLHREGHRLLPSTRLSSKGVCGGWHRKQAIGKGKQYPLHIRVQLSFSFPICGARSIIAMRRLLRLRWLLVFFLLLSQSLSYCRRRGKRKRRRRRRRRRRRCLLLLRSTLFVGFHFLYGDAPHTFCSTGGLAALHGARQQRRRGGGVSFFTISRMRFFLLFFVLLCTFLFCPPWRRRWVGRLAAAAPLSWT